MRMDGQKRAIHALNRLTFGPRPGDVERVTQMGVDQWIDLELHPDKIDDSALDARLGSVPYAADGHERDRREFSAQSVDQADRRRESLAAARSRPARGVRSATPAYEDKQERKEEAAKSEAGRRRATQNPSARL